MFSKLSIKNFALLRDAQIEFSRGFTAVTGETGAGKTLLAGAISFLIGGKTSPSMVRDGAHSAVVEGEFILESGNEPVIMRRELTSSGRSRAFIQDSPVGLKELTKIGSKLVDITAQRTFSHLLDPVRHIDFLDLYAGLSEQRVELVALTQNHTSLRSQLKKLLRRQDEFRQHRELLEFQLREIQSLDPQPDEMDELEAEIKRLEHFEEFVNGARMFEEVMSGDEKAVLSGLAEASVQLGVIVGIDKELSEIASDFEAARSTLVEIVRRVSEKQRRMVYEDARLEELRDRHHRLTGLARKFGGSLATVLRLKEKLEKELESGDATGIEIEKVGEKLKAILKQWIKISNHISKIRRSAKKQLQNRVIKSLSEMGVKNASFDINVKPIINTDELADGEPDSLSELGVETVEFYLSTNPGLEVRSLAQVASGGELSRLLLALKEALPIADSEATILFDEIDTGISGRIARLVGKKLKELAAQRQLLAITHLPQIASLADHHLRVAKRPEAGSTISEIVELRDSDRINELAMLLSGGTITTEAVRQAEHLVNNIE